MASRRERTRSERAGEGERRPPGTPFPEGPGDAGKRGDPPLEAPLGERSRHGRTGDRRSEEEP